MSALQNPPLESKDSLDVDVEKNFKIVVIGDGAVGKTALCEVYAKGKFPEGYSPTVFDSYPREIKNGDQVWHQQKFFLCKQRVSEMYCPFRVYNISL